MRQTALLLSLAAVVALAGCTGLGGDGVGVDDLAGNDTTDDGAAGSGAADGDGNGTDTATTDGTDDATGDGADTTATNDTGGTTTDEGASDGENTSTTTDDTARPSDGPEPQGYVEVLRPRTTEVVQVRFENDTLRNVRLAGIDAPNHTTEVSPNHSFAKIQSDSTALGCLDSEAETAWKYLHNRGGPVYGLVPDGTTPGVHLVRRDADEILNAQYLRLGYAQYTGTEHYRDRYEAAQNTARREVDGIWFCAPPGTVW